MNPLLLPLTPLWKAGVSLRGWAYRTGRLERRRLRAPVVSVGNLVVGGVGKTPVVAALARDFRDRGFRVAILSRGYGRSGHATVVVSVGAGPLVGPDRAGDEPYLLARELTGVAVVVGADRVAAGELAEERFGADVHILDDGFQHLRLERDVDVLLLDSASTTARLRLLPAGPLREPLAAMSRADVVLLTRPHRAHDEIGLRRLVRQHNPTAPIGTAERRLLGLRAADGAERELAAVSGRRVLALSAIGDPGQFEEDLESLGAVLVERIRRRDHHRFDPRDVREIERAAARGRADLVITTAKDLVRLEALVAPRLPLFALRMEAVLRDAPELNRRISSVLAPRARAGQ